MNDRFMYASQPELRPQFVEELYANISKQRGLLHLLKQVPLHIRRPRVWVSLLVILLLFVACARQFISPEAHHAANINGINLVETNYIPHVMSWYFSNEGAEEAIESIILSHGEFASDEQYMVPLDEAIDQLPYTFNMPTWVPESYSLIGEVRENPSMRRLFAIWVSEEKDGRIQLVTHQATSGQIKAAPGKWEVIEINGVEVVVIRGRFGPLFESIEDYRAFLESDEKEIRTYWDDDLGTQIVWIDNGVYFQLGSPGFIGAAGYFSPLQSTDFASEEDLIRMAESMIIE
ncbi:MAG: hypothetical protein DWQ07_05310 [Chloroflexi bacterium]|nr:MAG: hypothetical protein DWQ07_05310 [Chloroflexota bacterium]MBL1194851.1 hypothetical protein [Chloroflexota bacterium]NOH12142.1 hypothetical protein [Chloroflexota bacterium]